MPPSEPDVAAYAQCMIFANRIEAAHRLAKALGHLGLDHPLVLAIPRGAVPMAAIIADALGGEVDVALVRKLGAPGNPEFAIGSVDEDGHIELVDHIDLTEATPDFIEREAAEQLQTIRNRRKQYTAVRPSIDPAGRDVIVVDDGVATGATMLSALRAVRRKHPRRLVAATAVAPPDTARRLRKEADDVVVLAEPENFHAVGQFFTDFGQVSDEEVVELLLNSGAPTGGS